MFEIKDNDAFTADDGEFQLPLVLATGEIYGALGQMKSHDSAEQQGEVCKYYPSLTLTEPHPRAGSTKAQEVHLPAQPVPVPENGIRTPAGDPRLERKTAKTDKSVLDDYSMKDIIKNSGEMLDYLRPENLKNVTGELALGAPSVETLHMLQKLLHSGSPLAKAVAGKIVSDTNAILPEHGPKASISLNYAEKSLTWHDNPMMHVVRDKHWNLSNKPDDRLVAFADQSSVDNLVKDIEDGKAGANTLLMFGELLGEKKTSAKAVGITFAESVAQQIVEQANEALRSKSVDGRFYELHLSLKNQTLDVMPRPQSLEGHPSDEQWKMFLNEEARLSKQTLRYDLKSYLKK
ncbi:MAG: hypothetical protein K2W95_06405 [Candidatus Obscuribacterales bacterium]|nr:hypothetical protein [Candidatus Obscuribacterales bacterium]